MHDVFFNKNRFIGPDTITVKCGRGGKGSKTLNTLDLPAQSQQLIIVACVHGQRQVRWSRRMQMCKKCAVEAKAFNSSLPGRSVTWGDKISQAKKGIQFTKEHKVALVEARRKKLAERLNKPIAEVDFPTKSSQYKIRLFMMGALKKMPLNKSMAEQDKLFDKYLGYSVDDLKLHLESRFQPGMTWDNYGNGKNEWEIDHVTPDSWFSYSSPDDPHFKESWSLNNLQPMWAEQNRRKNNLYCGPYKERNIYFLCGQAGVGKSTVAAKLSDYFTVLDKDDFKQIKELDSAISANWHNDKPILLQIGVHVSTTIKRYTNKGYSVKAFFIIEDSSVVVNRIESRGGSRIHNVEARGKRMLALALEHAIAFDKADMMVQYLIEYGKKTIRDRHGSGVAT